MEALIEAIGSLLTLIFEGFRLSLRGVTAGLEALLVKEKRETFESEWKSSAGFRAGIFLSGFMFIGFISFVVYAFSFFSFGPSDREISNHHVPEKAITNGSDEEKINLKLKTEKSEFEVSVNKETAKSAWEASKSLFSKAKEKLSKNEEVEQLQEGSGG